MIKIKQKKLFRGIKIMVNYAFKNCNKLYIFSYLCSLIKLYCTISPYFLNKVICYLYYYLFSVKKELKCHFFLFYV